MRPALDVAQIQSSAATLGDRDCDPTGVFLCSVGITTVLKERKTPFDGIEFKSDELVCDNLRVRDLAAVNLE